MLDQDFGSKQQQTRLHMQETREDGSTSAVHEKGSNPLSCVARLPLPCSPDSAWLEICGDTKRPKDGGGCERDAHFLHAPERGVAWLPAASSSGRTASQTCPRSSTGSPPAAHTRITAAPSETRIWRLLCRRSGNTLQPSSRFGRASAQQRAFRRRRPQLSHRAPCKVRGARCGHRFSAAFINPPFVKYTSGPASKRRRTRVARASGVAAVAAHCRRRSRRARAWDAAPAPSVTWPTVDRILASTN
jgi:hypothetical protein